MFSIFIYNVQNLRPVFVDKNFYKTTLSFVASVFSYKIHKYRSVLPKIMHTKLQHKQLRPAGRLRKSRSCLNVLKGFPISINARNTICKQI